MPDIYSAVKVWDGEKKGGGGKRKSREGEQ